MANKKYFFPEARLIFRSDLNYFFFLYPLEKYFIKTSDYIFRENIYFSYG